MFERRFDGTRRHMLGTGIGVGIAWSTAPLAALAQSIPRIPATFTDLTSDTARMISYRHQEHLWQTADGSLHMIVNRGTLAPWPALNLYSSHDGGTSWQFQAAFPGTDDDSVADGQLEGNDLAVVFQTANDDLMHQVLRYDPASRTWSLQRDEVAYASPQFRGLNPALGRDGDGTLWCGYVSRDRATDDVVIRLLARPAAGAGWAETGLTFGPVDRRSIERSARPLAIPGGMGMVYTVRETTYWAVRPNGMATEAPWTTSVIYIGTPAFRTADPYASHFSVVSDSAGNTHMSTIDNNNVQYYRRDAATGLWSTIPQLLSDKKSAYHQMTVVNGRLMVAWSAQRGFGNAAVSANGGSSFQLAATLVLPPDAPGVSYGQARVEMPTVGTGPAKIFQQYTDNGLFRLMLFTVPQ